MIGFSPSVFGHGDPQDFLPGAEIAHSDGSFTVERLYDELFDVPGVGIVPCRVLSIQENGTVQWRPAGTAGPYEKCSKSSGFYAYAPALRFRGDDTKPMFAVPRLDSFTV